MMTEEEINELIHLRDAIDTVLGYISDNSCGDPECCGGPYYSDEEFVIAKSVVENYRGDRLEENEMLREALGKIAASAYVSVGTHKHMHMAWREIACRRIDIARDALGVPA